MEKNIILDAENLLGDSLYSLRPISCAKDSIACLRVGGGFAGELFAPFKKDFPVVRTMDEATEIVRRDNVQNPQFRKLDADKAARICLATKPIKHISEGYAEMLGVAVDTIVPLTDWMHGKQEGYEHIGIAPFSRSCARHSGLPATKTLDDWKWRYVVNYMRKLGFPLRVYCSEFERLAYVKICEDEYFYPDTLAELEASFRSCKLLVSVDNGLAHIASCCNTPTIILWPGLALPLEFIAPGWSATTQFVLMREPPDKIIPAALMHGIRVKTRELLYGVQR